MDVRRHKDIIAVRTGTGRPVALHARNLSIAELSDDAWKALSPNAGSRLGEALDELEAWNLFDDPETQADTTAFGVRSLTLNVTQICNLHCTYCAAGGDGTYGDPVQRISIEKTLPQIEFFLDQLKPGQSFHIAFLGGEPLLYPEAVKGIGRYVLEEAARRDLRATFKVTTNGTLIGAKAIDALTAIRANVVVSMDGPADLHDRQRLTKSGGGSFEAVFKGLKALLDNRQRLGRIGVHAVFNEKNLEVEKAWDFFQTLSVDDIDFTYTVADSDREATRVYNEGIARVAEKAWNKGGEAELTRIGSFRSIFARLDGKRRLENHCGMGKTMMVVDSHNKLWSCPWTIGKRDNLLGEGADLDYDRLEGHRGTIIERNDCGDCWARFVCGGGCSFVHGTTAGKNALKKKDDYCERTRFLIAQALVYYHRARTAEAG